MFRFGAMAWLGVLLVAAGGCESSSQQIRIRLEAYEPADRIRAIREATQAGHDDLIPALVDRLDDDDAAVRFYAVLALEELTGTRLGYSYSAPPQQRRRGVQLWRDFVEQRALAVREVSTSGLATEAKGNGPPHSDAPQ